MRLREDAAVRCSRTNPASSILLAGATSSVDSVDADRHIFSMPARPYRDSMHRRVAMRPANSSSIAAAGYDRDSQILRVRFVGGATYDYRGVPADVFQGFLNAPSRGQFVNWRIKPFYAYTRLRRPT